MSSAASDLHDSPAQVNRVRLAWTLILSGFTLFLLLVVSIPIVTSTYLRNARHSMTIVVQANQGAVAIDDAAGQRQAVFTGEPPRLVDGNTALITDSSDTGLLLLYSPDVPDLLVVRVQLYGSSSVRVVSATSPRYLVSEQTDEVELNLISGRITITIPPNAAENMLDLRIQTPHGIVYLREPGQYSLMVSSAETQATVQSGQLLIEGAGQQLLLQAEERAVLPLDSTPQGPLSAERNLIRNGDFRSGPDGLSSWVPLAWDIERADQPAGEIGVTLVGGEPALRINRVGTGHADTSVRQVVNHDVTDFQSLELRLTMRLVSQSLPVCGTIGSECPLTVEINYLDQNGSIRTWQQGFFAEGEFGSDALDVCQYCPPPHNVHERVLLSQLSIYDSGNILALLAQSGIEMQRVNSISITAAGHSFEVELLDIDLIARE